MATKRKHVDFEEYSAPAASPAPTGPVIHPSRMAGNAVLAKAAGPDGASAIKTAKKNKVRRVPCDSEAYQLMGVDCCQAEIFEGQGEETSEVESCKEGFCAKEQGVQGGTGGRQ
jgi:hypothetical protein